MSMTSGKHLVFMMLLLFSLFLVGENQVAANEEDGFTYVDNQPHTIPYYPGGVTLTGDLNSSRKDLVIPDTLGGKPVTTIGVYAFQYKQLNSVTMSNNVKVIGSGAFQNNQLTSITLSNQLEFIGTNAFNNNNLSSITIPSSVKEIWDNALIGNDLKTITILGSETELKQNSIPSNTKIIAVVPSKTQEYADDNRFAFEEISNKITYDGNGQTSGEVSEDYTGKTTSTFFVKDQGSLKKTGNTFTGWNSKQDGSGTDYKIGEEKLINQDLTLYAKWEKSKYTVSYQTDGGTTLSDITVEHNQTIAVPTGVTKQGHSFEGWYTDSNLTTKYSFTTPVTSNLTLYAKWEINKYTVSYETDGGTTLPNITVDYNHTIGVPTGVTKPGYSLEGWYTDSNLTTKYNFTTPITSNLILYAKWEVNQYTVSHETDGGTTLPNITVDYNHMIDVPTGVTKSGYALEGWYTDSNLTTKYNFTAPVTSNLTLYAKWEVEQYEVTFNTNGGSTIASQFVDYNTKATAPNVSTKVGYTFGGWYKEATFTNSWDFTKNTVTGNTMLYAKWYYIPFLPQNVTLSFETNGGNMISNLSVAYDTKLVELPIPTKDGFIFEGWYQDVAMTKKWDLATDSVIKDTKLYAKWVAKIPPTPNPDPIPDKSFNDISEHWAKEMIEELASQRIIAGYPDGSFRPNEFIQRQHVALIFHSTFDSEPTRDLVSFSDVLPNHPYYEAIMTLQKAGIVDGSNGKYNPNAMLTRAEMAKIVVLALGIKSGGTSAFPDVPSTHWSYAYIAALAEQEIVLGDNGKFKPDEPVTRAQFVSIMYRVLKHIK